MRGNIREEARVATAEDIEALIKLRFDYFAAEGWPVDDALREQIKVQLREYFVSHIGKDFFAFLVECDETTAARVSRDCGAPASPSMPKGRIGTVLNVLTYPKHRKRGYAGKVMSLLIETAKRLNLSFIELSSSKMGKPLYEKFGFATNESNYTEMRLKFF